MPNDLGITFHKICKTLQTYNIYANKPIADRSVICIIAIILTHYMDENSHEEALPFREIFKLVCSYYPVPKFEPKRIPGFYQLSTKEKKLRENYRKNYR